MTAEKLFDSLVLGELLLLYVLEDEPVRFKQRPSLRTALGLATLMALSLQGYVTIEHERVQLRAAVTQQPALGATVSKHPILRAALEFLETQADLSPAEAVRGFNRRLGLPKRYLERLLSEGHVQQERRLGIFLTQRYTPTQGSIKDVLRAKLEQDNPPEKALLLQALLEVLTSPAASENSPAASPAPTYAEGSSHGAGVPDGFADSALAFYLFSGVIQDVFDSASSESDDGGDNGSSDSGWDDDGDSGGDDGGDNGGDGGDGGADGGGGDGGGE